MAMNMMMTMMPCEKGRTSKLYIVCKLVMIIDYNVNDNENDDDNDEDDDNDCNDDDDDAL